MTGLSSKPSYLRVAGIAKSFGDVAALKDVSLSVNEGEFVCFLGPSGCGKTTLLRVIAGLEPQDAGRIERGGRDISSLPAAQRDFGIVFQSYALFPNLTVAGNVAYGLSRRGLGRAGIAARVDELLDMVGLPGIGGRYPAQLSGGQQQRVALVRALAPAPGLLLLDEPLSALDARVRVRLRQQIKALQRRLGVTTIMVTHDQEEALTLADRIAVMNHGAIEQAGTPLEIYRRPASRFVADFVGVMNVLDATADGGTARVGARTLRLSDGTAQSGPVHLCIRPEDIVVRGVGAATVNAVSARIETLEFTGPFFRATLRLDGGDATLVADLSANDVSDLTLAAGQPITVVLPPDRLRLYPRET
ncbi:MAG: putative 2-aminoethylphosphonate ABC transporter ATP-binding protein [Alphaproteobacteria bacterium]|nr:putative 2-aminoethylphosphonate ABC transporter ATP-binding protein [Alphaproteobacteria bacterium]